MEFTKQHGGIEYAEKVMVEYANKAKSMLACYPDGDVKTSLMEYVDYVIYRNY